MARLPKPKTKLIRIRISDAERLKRLANARNKQLPDFMAELLRKRKMKGGKI